MPPLWREPGYVLRLAGSARERRSGVVLRSFACDAIMSASHRCGARGGDPRVAPAISPSGSAQAVADFAATRWRDGLAGGLDDRRHPETGRPRRKSQAPAPAARSAAPRDRSRGGQRGMGGDPLRQRRAVWLARSGRAVAAFGVVAQAWRRTAFHSARLAAGERTSRAHASHAEEADLAAARSRRRGAASPVRRIPPTLQPRAPARGARAKAAGRSLRALAAGHAGADRRPLVRRRPSGPSGGNAGPDQMAG